MILLYLDCDDKGKRLLEHIERQTCGDYIYDYPPRQSYRAFTYTEDWFTILRRSLSMSDELNLYFHFPFCKQICSYCNLFAICDVSQARFEEYFTVLEKELDTYIPYISDKRINTIYLGGGTPSWIPAELFKQLFDRLESRLNTRIRDVQEVAIEMSPDTADLERIRKYRDIGINRANIGVQAVDNSELSCIGRRYSEGMIFQALENVMQGGLHNVCVDLIYGLEGQSMESWQRSLKQVVSYAPPTICTYPLTLREHTGFAQKGYSTVNGAEQYEKYQFGYAYLLANGYEQETHVRYKKKGSNGGYIQKENHWKQQNILGFGAGARSYLKEINCRNGYSVVNRHKAYDRYIEQIRTTGIAATDGMFMPQDERMRKWLVLGLDGLDTLAFKAHFGKTPMELFPDEFGVLTDNGLVRVQDGRIVLTHDGTKYRDLIVQMFFSDNVTRLVREHSYNE